MVQAAASLSSSLLVAKGQASAQGFKPGEPSRLASLAPIPAAGDPAPPRPARRTPASPGARPRRAKLSLRLDPERHLRLKLAAAHLGRNGQELLTIALDRYLAQVLPRALEGRCHCLEATRAVGGSGRCGG